MAVFKIKISSTDSIQFTFADVPNFGFDVINNKGDSEINMTICNKYTCKK